MLNAEQLDRYRAALAHYMAAAEGNHKATPSDYEHGRRDAYKHALEILAEIGEQ